MESRTMRYFKKTEVHFPRKTQCIAKNVLSPAPPPRKLVPHLNQNFERIFACKAAKCGTCHLLGLENQYYDIRPVGHAACYYPTGAIGLT